MQSRSLWLNVGDKNTRFFHVITFKHRVANRIDHIIKGGIKLECEEEISKVDVEIFTDLLRANHSLDLEAQTNLVDSIPKILTEDQNRMLATIPSNEEIKKVVFSFEGNKAPGPDGVAMFFSQTS